MGGGSSAPKPGEQEPTSNTRPSAGQQANQSSPQPKSPSPQLNPWNQPKAAAATDYSRSFSTVMRMPGVAGNMSQLQFNTILSIDRLHPAHLRANRIICTIGPKTQTVDALKQLMERGMSVARMNFSHGSYEFHKTTIDNVRQAAKEMKMHIAIALDTKGPEIRTGKFTSPTGVELKAGETVLVTSDTSFELTGDATKFYIDYPNLSKVTRVGGHIFIDDGVLNLEIVEKVDATTLKCLIHNTHVLTNQKGCNLPQANVDLPAVSEKDKADLAFGAKEDVDMIFASFIRNAQQVREVRAALGDKGSKIQVIAKIENHQGVEDIDAIIDEADGIMVARGDLGVEIPAEKVVVAQKLLISKCNVAGKPVICATQMLESMTTNPRPTRAEVSDVANAVLDGADCVMLSGETAKGKYPNEVVSYMAKICLEAQAASRTAVMFSSIKDLQPIPMSAEEAICSSAVNTVQEIEAKAIVCLSNTGRSAKLIAKYRPPCPVICASQSGEICRALTIVRSVVPVFYDVDTLGEDKDRSRRVKLCIDEGLSKGFFQSGDYVVAVHADMFTVGFANQTRVIVVP
jgi:pyruvate kinase